MTKKFVLKIFRIFEIVLIFASIVLNRLSFKKMGVMRHLVYRNYVLESKGIGKFLPFLLLLIFVFYFVLKFLRKLKFRKSDFLFFVFFIVAILAFFRIAPFKYDYYYQMMTYSFLSILEIIILNIKAK